MNTKQAALDQALTTITGPLAAPRKAKRPKSKAENPPDKFTNALQAFTAEHRKTGWWISRPWTASAAEKPRWSGPFATIESACLAIARRLAIEIAHRHTQCVPA